jgi:non-specific protein-tyrosine kinase
VTADEEARPVSALPDYLGLLWRRKWLILQAIIVVPLVAVLLARREAPVYEASAQVLLNRQNLAASLTNIDDPAFWDPERALATQAALARVPEVARSVVEAAGVDMSPADFLGSSSVTASQDTDLLTFSVVGSDPALPPRLATEYAQQFTEYRRELDTRALKSAQQAAHERIAELEAAGQQDSQLYGSLVQKEQQLSAMEALQTERAVLVRPATGAGQIKPSPMRHGIIGLALGVVLGLVLAVLWETLDTRVHSAQRIRERLGLPLLGRIPQSPRHLRRNDELIMLAAPDEPRAEAFRMLRTSLELAMFGRHARTIMITSAIPDEGKSLTAANLAVALAQTGKRVALVDIDLRAASLARLFGVDDHEAGLTNVVLGRVNLDEAIVSVPVGKSDLAVPATGNGHGDIERTLHVLPSGPLPPNPGDFVASENAIAILKELGRRADVVLIDTAPLLIAGDAMTLSTHVDALMLVTRLNVLRSHMLDELDRILEASPVTKLGFVVTGAKGNEPYTDIRYPNTHPFPKQASGLLRHRQSVGKSSVRDSRVLGDETTPQV